MSMSSQSNPAPAATSVATDDVSDSQRPICGVPAMSARLNLFSRSSFLMVVVILVGSLLSVVGVNIIEKNS